MNRRKIIIIGAIIITILIIAIVIVLVLRNRNKEEAPVQIPAQPAQQIPAQPAQNEQPTTPQIPTQTNPPSTPNNSTFDNSQSEQEIEAQKEQFLDMIYKKYPLLNYLPYESDHFAIDYGPETYGSSNYIFYIEIIYSMAEIDQIDAFRQQALDWIKSKGTDPNTLNISWE